jgi:pyridoxine kinase
MDNNTPKKILLINDMPGYGKVALAAMMPILSNMKYEVHDLPTALVSNTLDYGKFEILETTGYMKNTLKVWEELGFVFDAISTGFIVSEEQAALIAEHCEKQSTKGVKIFVDPIMGDDGKLYNGITEKNIEYMRRLCNVADVIVPNITEAAFLTDKYTGRTVHTKSEVDEIAGALRTMGAKNVVITSASSEEGSFTAIMPEHEKKISVLPFTNIPVRFPGTGDIFSALMIGKYLEEGDLMNSVRYAMNKVADLIRRNKENADKYKGIPIEQCLDLLRQE